MTNQHPWPVIQHHKVFHVGTLDKKDLHRHGAKGGGGMEGDQLSVSLHPEEWRKIARLGDLPTYLLKHPERHLRFLDMHRLTEEQISSILKWAEEQHLITHQDMYLAWCYDEDRGKCFSIYENLEEALYESEFDTDFLEAAPFGLPTDAFKENGEEKLIERIINDKRHLDELNRQYQADTGIEAVTRKSIPRATQTLNDLLGYTHNPDATDFACIAYAKHLGMDGVWWNEELSPEIYSAPRGLIFSERVSELSHHIIP